MPPPPPKRTFINAEYGAEGRPTNSNTPNLDNVQGDVYFTFPKQWEHFLFFQIRDNQVQQFRENLAKYAPMITSSRETARHHAYNQLDIVSTAVAFSRAGLNALDKEDDLEDPHFDPGSLVLERDKLGDQMPYDDAFKTDGATHGVIVVTARAQQACQNKTDVIKGIFKNSINVVKLYEGHIRPGDREHFGWKDGISQPAMKCEWHTNFKRGQRVVEPGVIIMGYPGDPFYGNRPRWTKDGSFMVFRKLEQNVMFFEDYINEFSERVEVPSHISLNAEQKKALFGARMFGRFKSGVPLARCPYKEDSEYQKPEKINDFDYTEEGDGCPLYAHIRKTEPRNSLPVVRKEYLDASVIIRAGIPYGDEVSAREREDWKKVPKHKREGTKSPRGLLFVCYQSSIDNGFFRQTTGFANNDHFPVASLVSTKIGQDPIIGGPPKETNVSGQVDDIAEEGAVSLLISGKGGVKFRVNGVVEKVNTSPNTIPQKFFVTSNGGEYYFVPSIQTVKDWAQGN